MDIEIEMNGLFSEWSKYLFIMLDITCEIRTITRTGSDRQYKRYEM